MGTVHHAHREQAIYKEVGILPMLICRACLFPSRARGAFANTPKWFKSDAQASETRRCLAKSWCSTSLQEPRFVFNATAVKRRSYVPLQHLSAEFMLLDSCGHST